jgi:uncharacterized protein YdeI (YjbR/CyaY-like superfamily)
VTASIFMVVNKALREAAGAAIGDTVQIEMVPDRAPRAVELADDIKAALRENREAGESFVRLSHSHQREYVDFINEAKRSETRAIRIKKSVTMLIAGKRLK